ncbi:hypothetical protein Vi05172_g7442 [Venturia inaequalis]|nr:hypothetical protein Vi05172_g7442 [Venturia inaequalis]
MDNLSVAFVPLKWIIDTITALCYLPSSFPLTSYRETARKMASINEAAAKVSYAFVKRQMARNANRPSYVANLLASCTGENGHVDPKDEEAIKWTAVSMYAAGSDSSVAVMQSVICALCIFPSVVSRAQEEINSVVGNNRLPTFSDRERLPFTNGIVKEAWRWNPVGPMGLAHAGEEDIVYGEYLIPKGSYPLPSLWWFLNDPATCSEPEIFKPERYLAPFNEPDPSDIAFGYGRRSCAGRFFADASLYITFVHLLSVFNIKKRKDADGKETEVKLEFVAGMVNRPKPFAWQVEVRNEKCSELLRRLQFEQEVVEGDSALWDL